MIRITLYANWVQTKIGVFQSKMQNSSLFLSLGVSFLQPAVAHRLRRCGATKIMVSRFSIICTILCSNVWFVWNHKWFGFSKTCEPYFCPSYGQFMIFLYAILLYGQCMTFTIYDLLNSCIFYDGEPGKTLNITTERGQLDLLRSVEHLQCQFI